MHPEIGNKRSAIDLCIHFKWIWTIWVNYNLILRIRKAVKNDKLSMMTKFECIEEGPMKDFVGCIMTIRMNKGENARL